ncbi:MAG: cyclic lactone autoinducer peptide [Clostridiaceae bacterium]
MNKFNKKFFTLVATITTVVAASVASSACLWYTYQPEEPKCLSED